MAAHVGDVQPCISTTRYLQEIYSQIRAFAKKRQFMHDFMSPGHYLLHSRLYGGLC